MPPTDRGTVKIWDILWESLAGGSYDIDSLRIRARDDSHFVEDLSIDSLDLLEFYLRLDENFRVSLAEDDYPSLTSVQAIATFLKARAPLP